MSAVLKVNTEEYMPLRDVVFNTLRQAIIEGELKPGERLLEIQLADRLGVSRTPIREAIRKLELEGLVVMTPRHGATVAGITSKNLKDVLEIRGALEELAIELACQRMSDEQAEELRQVNRAFNEILDTDDALALANRDEEFHDCIYNATGNPRLQQILANLREQMYRYRLVYIKDKDKRQVLASEHEKILDAVVNRRITEARQAIREHIDNQVLTILDSIKE